MRRVVMPELLDSDSGTPKQIAESLEDLRWLNRNFGGISTTTALLLKVTAKIGVNRLTMLDVAGATGDVAEGAGTRLGEHGIELEVTVLDRAVTHLSHAAPCVVGDAFQLPFRDGAFDVVGSALFVHHLEPPQADTFLREAMRVSRSAVIINDLGRGYFHLISAFAGRLLYRSRITAHDSVASVRRAYTQTEIKEILEEMELESFELSSHYFCRFGAILWKKTPT